MGTTNLLLREILQEIREVKAHIIPAPRPSAVSSAGGGASETNSLNRNGGLKTGGFRSKTFSMEKPAPWHGQIGKPTSAGGGSEISGLSFKNILSKVANASKSEREHISSLLGSSKKAPNKVTANLYFNPAMDCFVDKEGNCFYSNLNETTLDPVPNMSRMIGKLRPGVNREQAQESNFVASNARSRKRKNRRNRTRKN